MSFFGACLLAAPRAGFLTPGRQHLLESARLEGGARHRALRPAGVPREVQWRFTRCGVLNGTGTPCRPGTGGSPPALQVRARDWRVMSVEVV
jgi:hypothetical protein